MFRVSHEFGDSRSSYDFKSVYHMDRKDELIKHSVKFLLQEELIGVCIFWCSCHQCDEHSLNALIGNLNTSKTLTGDGLLARFCTLFIKEMYNWRLPCGSFLRTTIVNWGNSCKFKLRKAILVWRQWADLYSFSKVFSRYKRMMKYFF